MFCDVKEISIQSSEESESCNFVKNKLFSVL